MRQLDLFIDGGDALLVHDVVTALIAHDAGRAAAALARLRHEHARHPDLPALTRLLGALESRVVAPVTHVTVEASVDEIARVVDPAARRFLGTATAAFLRPSWQALAEAAEVLPFDDAYPQAHPGWLRQQYGDWVAARAAIESEPAWAAKPVLRYWQGLARHHLGEPEAAIRLWLPIGWMDPPLFARHAPTLPSVIVREGWQTFERSLGFDEFFGGVTEPAAWLPAWLLTRHRGLARVFTADDVGDPSPAARVFAAVVALAPLESEGLSAELIARRRALRELSPEFFRRYLDAVGRSR